MSFSYRAAIFSFLIGACSGQVASTPVTSTAGQPIVVPSDWVEVDSNCKFTFRASKDVLRKDVHGVDSCVGKHESESLSFGYDYGQYSSPLTEYKGNPNYSESTVSIDGVSAKLIACDEEAGRMVGVYIANDGRGAKLQASVFCATKGTCEDTARTLLSTIKWK